MLGLYGLLAVIALCWSLTVLKVFDVNRQAIDTAFIVSVIYTLIPVIAGHLTKMAAPWFKYLCLVCL